MAVKLSKGLLGNILNSYEEEQEVVFPADVELSDEQKYFVRGYLCANGENVESGTQKTDDAVRKQILQVRSKYCEPILELLAREGELYHGDLAEKMEMTPSGLNAIIKKMQEGDTTLIETMEIGKYKIYTIPDSVKNYMKNKNRSVDNRPVRKERGNGDLLLALQHFIESVGDGWKDKLNLFLQGEIDENGKDKNAYDKFVEQVRQTEQEGEDYIAMKEILNNEVLIYLLERYIVELKECEKIMEEIGRRKNGKKLLRHFTMQ